MDEPRLPEVELVLFHGPPFAGKTLYFQDIFSATHRRASIRVREKQVS
jgi:hypothetical protein